MELPVVDARLAAQQALQDDPVQRKLQIDALRDRLAEPNKDAAAQRKLKEACQGFEAIFLQRVWEQMRKNVAKEGYLHSRDEESYQSMFDQELVKKMADAGGIGLADMLQEQLSIKLGKASIASSPGMLKNKQHILALENPAMPLPTVPGFNDRPKAKGDELYTPLEQGNGGKDAAGKTAAQTVAAAELAAARVAPAQTQNSGSALSALPGPVENPARQAGLGMQSQFMLGAGLAARMGVNGNNSAGVAAPTLATAPAAGQIDPAAVQAGNQLLPGANALQQAGQANQANQILPGQNQSTGLEQALTQAAGPGQGQSLGAPGTALPGQGAMPPLPQLDNIPQAGGNAAALFRRPEGASGQPGVTEQSAAAEPARQRRRPRGFGGITMAEAQNTVKKSELNPFAQNWPVAGSGLNGRNRFAGGRQHNAQPEVGRAELEEPSILRPPTQSMGQAQGSPRNEAEIRDLPQGNAEGGGIRQISQAEVEAALRRMTN